MFPSSFAFFLANSGSLCCLTIVGNDLFSILPYASTENKDVTAPKHIKEEKVARCIEIKPQPFPFDINGAHHIYALWDKLITMMKWTNIEIEILFVL